MEKEQLGVQTLQHGTPGAAKAEAVRSRGPEEKTRLAPRGCQVGGFAVGLVALLAHRVEGMRPLISSCPACLLAGAGPVDLCSRAGRDRGVCPGSLSCLVLPVSPVSQLAAGLSRDAPEMKLISRVRFMDPDLPDRDVHNMRRACMP